MNRKPFSIALAIVFVMTSYWIGVSYSQQAPTSAMLSKGGTTDASTSGGDIVPYMFDPLRHANTKTTLASSGSAGTYSSITIGSDGMPLISYRDESNNHLLVAHCNDITCADGATISQLLSSNSQHTSITLGSDGLGIISFYDPNLGNLMVAHCASLLCVEKTVATIDAVGDVGQFNAITVSGDGNPLISYYDATNGNLKVAKCANVMCSSATLRTIDSSGNVGQFTSIAMRIANRALISYYDVTNGGLKVADCLVDCSSANLYTIDSANSGGVNGLMTSLAIGVDGMGIIAYHATFSGGRPKIAHCDNYVCSSATLHAVELVYDGSGINNSITISADGIPIMSYYNQNLSILRVARCKDIACTEVAAVPYPSLDGPNVGSNSSITIGIDGLPIISYYDLANGKLKVLHCGSPDCQSFAHRR